MLYQPGEIITLAKTDFIVLDTENDVLFLLAKDVCGQCEFGRRRTSNYMESDLRMQVEQWFTLMGRRGLSKEAALIRLIKLEGEGCGCWAVKAAPITYSEYQKYGDVIRRAKPAEDDWAWLADVPAEYQRQVGIQWAAVYNSAGQMKCLPTNFLSGVRPTLLVQNLGVPEKTNLAVLEGIISAIFAPQRVPAVAGAARHE